MLGSPVSALHPVAVLLLRRLGEYSGAGFKQHCLEEGKITIREFHNRAWC